MCESKIFLPQVVVGKLKKLMTFLQAFTANIKTVRLTSSFVAA